MNLFVLDTDICSLLHHNNTMVLRQVHAHAQDEIAISVITLGESVEGWLNYLRSATRPDRIARGYAELADTVAFLASWTVLPYTVQGVARYAQLRAMRLNVGHQDLRIAAIALEHNAIVVTRNLRDFQRVPGLPCENWAA